MKVSYFPGCTLRNVAKDLDLYARECAEKLGVTLCELPDCQCCGGVYVSAKDEIASKLSSVRALIAAKEENRPFKNALEVVGLPYRDKKLFSKYSLGMKQRLGIANAILHDPELLILDEPTNGLDPIGIAEVRNFIKDLSVDRGKTILISSHILSEIALLADDIGIIDHGVLLEESSMEELEKKNRKYIQLQVSDVPKASLILERQFHVTDYAVQDEHNLRLYDTALDMAAINKALVVQDVAVISSQICSDTLEDYFKQITGGEGIA